MLTLKVFFTEDWKLLVEPRCKGLASPTAAMLIQTVFCCGSRFNYCSNFEAMVREQKIYNDRLYKRITAHYGKVNWPSLQHNAQQFGLHKHTSQLFILNFTNSAWKTKCCVVHRKIWFKLIELYWKIHPNEYNFCLKNGMFY